MKKRKYRLLYSPGGGRKPGPKAPSKEVINAIVEMKRRNPRYGCPRIAQQLNLAFGLDIDKDVVRRILAVHYKPEPGNSGPSGIDEHFFSRKRGFATTLVDLQRNKVFDVRLGRSEASLEVYLRRLPVKTMSGSSSWTSPRPTATLPGSTYPEPKSSLTASMSFAW